MTLLRQLILGVSVLFFVLLAGVEAIYLANSRVQLQQQLASQGQEAATSLALRLAALRSLEDRALMETLLNPMFDRGYFQEIRVVAAGGETLARRALAPAQGGVPEWFVRLFPLEAHGAADHRLAAAPAARHRAGRGGDRRAGFQDHCVHAARANSPA